MYCGSDFPVGWSEFYIHGSQERNMKITLMMAFTFNAKTYNNKLNLTDPAESLRG